jgi:hypothetical protein
MRIPIYLIEKSAGLYDSNGVEVFYIVDAKLTKAAATDIADKIEGAARVRKIIATK